MKRLFLILFTLTLVGCYHSKKPVVEIKECNVVQIEELVGSTLDITPRYTIITDCGDTLQTSKDTYKIGQTIYLQKNYYQNQ